MIHTVGRLDRPAIEKALYIIYISDYALDVGLDLYSSLIMSASFSAVA